MRWIFLISLPLFGGAVISNIEPTATQAIVTILTDQSGGCTIRASEGTSLGTMVNDVNTSLFSGSNSTSRPGTVLFPAVAVAPPGTTQYKFVLGTPYSQDSPSDGLSYSRALRNSTQHIVGATCGIFSEVTALFSTGNQDTGITLQGPRFNRAHPGDYNYPSIITKAQNSETIDPDTGNNVVLATLPKQIAPASNTGLTLKATFVPGGGDWSCTGQACAYSGTSQQMLYLPITALSTGSSTSPLPAIFNGPPGLIGSNADWAELVTANLSGSAAGVKVYLTRDGVNPAGKAITQAITGTPTAYTIGGTAAAFNDWRSGPRPPVGVRDILQQTATVTKAGAVVTYASGTYFRTDDITAGSNVILGSTTCAVASIQSDQQLTLASAGCVTDGSYTMTVNNFGFLLQASTNASGTITLASGSTWNLGSSGVPGMPSAGFFNNILSPVSSTGPGSVGGYPSATAQAYGPPFTSSLADLVQWIGPNQHATVVGFSDLGSTPTGMANGTCRNTNGLIWDGIQSGVFYCTGIPMSTFSPNAIVKVTYSGAYPAATPSASATLPSSSSSVLISNINTAVAAFDMTGAFTAYESFVGGTPSWELNGWQAAGTAGQLILVSRTRQNAAAWWIAFSLDSNTVVAARNTYAGASLSYSRWCGEHSGTQSLQYTYVVDTCNGTIASSVNGSNYTVSSTGTFGAAPWDNCPANPIGASGNNCTTVSVGSLTPLDSTSASLVSQTILVGDVVSLGGECMRAAVISGLSITWQRAYNLGAGNCQGSGAHPANSTLSMTSSGQGYETWWNPATDPTGASLILDTYSSDCHYGYGVNTYVMGCIGPPGSNYTGKPIRAGALPGNLSNIPFWVNFDAQFAGSTQFVGDNQNQSHPSNTQSNASVQEQGHFIDNRPYGKSGTPVSGVTLVAGRNQTYLIPAASLPNFQYRIRQWAVSSNTHIAVDVSGPASVLSDSNSDNFKYCNVLIANECVTGSTPGQTYVNFPFVSQMSGHTCYTSGGTLPPINDIAFDEWQDTALGVLEADTTRGWDPSGSGVRLLSSTFAPICTQGVFWNSREIAPAGIVYTVVDFLDGVQSQAVMISNPSFPPATAQNNANFIPVPFKFTGIAGDTVKVGFGYAEFDQGQLALGELPVCHSRNDTCWTNSTGSTPFLWGSETASPTACNPSCTVTANIAPRSGGRIVYFEVVRQNGSNVIVSPLDVMIVR